MCVPGELQLGKGKAGEGQSILQRVNGTERRETRQLWNRPEVNLVAKVGCSSPTHWDSSPLGAATGRVLLSGSKSSPWEDLKGALWKGEKRGPPGDLSPPRTERFPRAFSLLRPAALLGGCGTSRGRASAAQRREPPERGSVRDSGSSAAGGAGAGSWQLGQRRGARPWVPAEGATPVPSRGSSDGRVRVPTAK